MTCRRGARDRVPVTIAIDNYLGDAATEVALTLSERLDYSLRQITERMSAKLFTCEFANLSFEVETQKEQIEEKI